MEEWKDLNSVLGKYYQISNTGKLKNKLTNKILKPTPDKRGYPRFRLSVKAFKVSLRLHRLVAYHFIENPENKPQVNHIDGNKLNNNVNNLEWNTNSENQLHAVRTGLKITKKGKESCRFKSSILVFDLLGNQVDELFGNEDMKNKGYDFRNVSAVVTGKRKTYKKLIFKRK